MLRTKLDEIEQWKRRVSDKELELSKLKNLENELQNYESKYDMLQAENDRVNKILKSRQAEIEDWKGKTNSLQSRIENFTLVER